MQRIALSLGLKLLRTVSLVMMAVIGTIALMQFAPGFFTDAREMDGKYASEARKEISERKEVSGSVTQSVTHLFRGLSRGDLGFSSQFQVPVAHLVKERLSVTVGLLVEALALGWTLAFTLALLLGVRRRRTGEGVIAIATSALLCIPVAVIATVCLVTDHGGPVFVLGSLIAIRDFKMTYRLLRSTSRAPQLLYARAQGYNFHRAVSVHLFSLLRGELLSLVMMSFVVALSAAVPVEVIFDRPGLGQLAWSAAMNRDLPVLASVTLLMAGLVAVAGAVADRHSGKEASLCA